MLWTWRDVDVVQILLSKDCGIYVSLFFLSPSNLEPSFKLIPNNESCFHVRYISHVLRNPPKKIISNPSSLNSFTYVSRFCHHFFFGYAMLHINSFYANIPFSLDSVAASICGLCEDCRIQVRRETFDSILGTITK